MKAANFIIGTKMNAIPMSTAVPKFGTKKNDIPMNTVSQPITKTKEPVGVRKFEYSTVIPTNKTPTKNDIATVNPMNTVECGPEHVFNDDHDDNGDNGQNADLNNKFPDDAIDTTTVAPRNTVECDFESNFNDDHKTRQR